MDSQEKYWYDDDTAKRYMQDNCSKKLFDSKFNLYKKIYNNINEKPRSVIEFGCNIGLNLDCFKKIDKKIQITGVEISDTACKILSEKKYDYNNQSIYDYIPNNKYDLSLVMGLLIHLNPDRLIDAYKKLYDSSNKYILIIEYYNPVPVTIKYRESAEKLFKRDFAGEILDIYGDLSLEDYGFVYHRDSKYPLDDLSWFLLKKRISK